MDIIIQCDQCHARLKIRRKISKGKCPRCGNAFEFQNKASIHEEETELPPIESPTIAYKRSDFDTDTEIPVSDLLFNKSVFTQDLKKKDASPDEQCQAVFHSLLNQIRQEFPKQSTSLSYRFLLTSVAICILLVPVIYIGTMHWTARHLYQYSVTNYREAFQAFQLKTILYPLTVFYGTSILIIFIKPFICCLNTPDRKRKLNRLEYPDLYRFVDYLCVIINAPRPKSIVIDLEGNASARFRSGSYFKRDELVLTIGLPLIANLSVSQFSGILAHEFAHFSQRWGMRLTQLVRVFHSWVEKSVRERDLIDQFISTSLHSGNPILIIIASLLWIPVKIVNFYLRILLFLTRLICSLLLREMEFEADCYQARLVGLNEMKKTFKTVLEINYSLIIAKHNLVKDNAFNEEATNFPEYVSQIRNYLPEEIQDCIQIHLSETKTSLFSTHPSFSDRISAQKKNRWPGMFQSQIPARYLINQFEELSISQTKKVFKHIIR